MSQDIVTFLQGVETSETYQPPYSATRKQLFILGKVDDLFNTPMS
jgi:hypothetical protein